MVGPRTLIAVLLATALAGCTGPADTDSGTPGSEPGDALEGTLRTDILRFAPDTHLDSETFQGSFTFEDNQQFAGSLQRELGMDPDNVQVHDITDLVPDEGLFRLQVVTDADPGSGDIDTWIMGGDAILNVWCDCPFGGHNELTAYGDADGSTIQVAIQYDEVSSGPGDPDMAPQGFDYTIDVTASAQPRAIPPGTPVAVGLHAVGDRFVIANHTEPVTVFGPDDQPLAVLESGEDTFTLEEGMTHGEHVLIGRFNGRPYDITIHHTGDDAPTARILDVDYAFAQAEYPPGQPARLAFDVLANSIEMGACGFAGDATVDPSFRIMDPDGESWASSADNSISLLGWGACRSNWLGTAPEVPGEYVVEYAETAGSGSELFAWTAEYVR